jgi:predicted nucleic-acid-binding protein
MVAVPAGKQARRGMRSSTDLAGRGLGGNADGVHRYERRDLPPDRRPAGDGVRATAALGGAHDLLLTDLVLAECVYVLESFYEVERPRVAELMRSAIGLRTIKTVDPAVLLRALEVYELDRLDFAEAYLVAQAEVTGVDAILGQHRPMACRTALSGQEATWPPLPPCRSGAHGRPAGAGSGSMGGQSTRRPASSANVPS